MYHNKVISYNEINSLPSRKQFLDTVLYDKVSNDIKSKNMLFLPNSIWERPMAEFKYDKFRYKLILFGVAEDGRKLSVIINDVEPYFEVKVKNEEHAIEVYKLLSKVSTEDFMLTCNRKKFSPSWSIAPTRYDICYGKPLKGFTENDSMYLKLYFNRVLQRNDAIKYLRFFQYETSHDDTSHYFRVVCRDYLLSYVSWLRLQEFDFETTGSNEYIKGDVIKVSINNINVESFDKPPAHITRDNTLSMCWDIETYNATEDESIPQPEVDEHNVFMIGITFQWYHSSQQLLRVCIVDSPIAPHPDFLSIVCSSEKDLIKALAIVISKMQPEFIFGFNDASYDWNWIINRAYRKYKGVLKYIGDKVDLTIDNDRTDDSTYKQFIGFNIKIDAENNMGGRNLQCPNYIPVDVMITFRQFFPKSEKWSLNFFLSKCKLGSKEDMPYQEMFDIYKKILEFKKQKLDVTLDDVKSDDVTSNNLLERFALVGKYCVIDAQRCHELMKIRNVIPDKREVANMSYVSENCAFYFANGMKVCNLVIALGQKRKLKISNIQSEVLDVGQYPGAFVFPPEKGLVSSKLNMRERIEKAKLGYEEYIEWLNVSEEMIEQAKITIEFYLRNGFYVIDEHIMFDGLKKMLEEATGRPVVGLDFNSLYPSLIMAYNLSPEYIIKNKQFARLMSKNHELHRIEFPYGGRTVKAWAVRHENKIDITKKEYKFGLFPAILKDLFDTRKQLKALLAPWVKKMEELDTDENRDPEEWEDVLFHYNYYNSKQNAVKVFMNTFYGVLGNKLSPLFMVEVAGAITTAGQNNIKKGHAYVTERDYKVYYGDSVAGYSPILIKVNNTVYTTEIQDLLDLINLLNKKGLLTDEICSYATNNHTTSYATNNHTTSYATNNHTTSYATNNHTTSYATNTNEDEKMFQWKPYPQFKPYEGKPVRINKEVVSVLSSSIYIWTADGWSVLNSIVRHKTQKRMIKIITDIGMIDVTEDHSLLMYDRKAKSPLNVNLYDRLFFNIPTIKNSDLQIYSTSSALTNNQINKQSLYLQCLKRGIDVGYLNTEGIYHFDNVNDSSTTMYTGQINQIIDLGIVNDYVYDLSTVSGTFMAGYGSICVFNTDSLYISAPESKFLQLDIDYYTEKISKIVYWEEMVKLTIDIFAQLSKEINEMYKNDNGTEFLRMAYEEALFPVLFVSKKKYVGIPHTDGPKFGATPFVRGLESSKRGASKLLKDTSDYVVKNCTSVTNTLTVMELVQQAIKNVYNTNWEGRIDDFVMSAAYRSGKKNQRMITFRDRMQSRGYIIRSGERVQYVVIQTEPYKYDLQGRQIPVKIGDKMELVGPEIDSSHLLIDLDYYVNNSLCGLLSRFIAYHSDFHVNAKSMSSQDMKKAEDEIMKKSKKYILAYAKTYYKKYTNNGAIYKKLYRESVNIVTNAMISKYNETDIHKMIIKSLSNIESNSSHELIDWLVNYIMKDVDKLYKSYGEIYVENYLHRIEKQHISRKEAILKLQKIYYDTNNSIREITNNRYRERFIVIKEKLFNKIKSLQTVRNINKNILEKIINSCKEELRQQDEKSLTEIFDKFFDSKYDDYSNYAWKQVEEKNKELETAFTDIKRLCVYIKSNYIYYYIVESIVQYLKYLRDKDIGIEPTSNDIIAEIEENENMAMEFLQENKHNKLLK